MTYLESGEMLTDQEFLYRWAMSGVETDMRIPTDEVKYISEKLSSAKTRLDEIVIGYLEKEI